MISWTIQAVSEYLHELIDDNEEENDSNYEIDRQMYVATKKSLIFILKASNQKVKGISTIFYQLLSVLFYSFSHVFI